AVYWSVAVQIGLVCLLTWLLTTADAFMPRMFQDDRSSTPVLQYAAGTLVLLSLTVLLLMWLRRRSVLDLWVMAGVAMVTSEMTLVTFKMTSRFNVGWYVSRALAVAFSAVVLIALLLEFLRLHSALERAYVALERERKSKLTTLGVTATSIAQELRQ